MTDISQSYCSNCGNKLSGDERFCRNCGNSVRDDTKIAQPKKLPLDIIKDIKIIFLFLLAILSVFWVIKIFDHELRLPIAVRQLYKEKEKNTTTYQLIDASKARYPENYGVGWFNIDEIWCVTVRREKVAEERGVDRTFLIYSDLVVRIGNDWQIFNANETDWDRVGCRHPHQ